MQIFHCTDISHMKDMTECGARLHSTVYRKPSIPSLWLLLVTWICNLTRWMLYESISLLEMLGYFEILEEKITHIVLTLKSVKVQAKLAPFQTSSPNPLD